MMAAGLGYRSYQPNTPRGRPSPEVEKAVGVLVNAGEYLVAQGADLDARDFRGRTPFRIAEGAKQSFQFQAFPETAELLRKLGANIRLGIPGSVHERADRDIVTTQSKTVAP